MYLTERAHNKTFMVIVLIAMMGIKALFFGNKDIKDAKQELIDLNEGLNNLQNHLTEERDAFEGKRQGYERGLEAITNKKLEVDNRIDYLNSVKATIGEKIALPSVDIKNLKEVCEQYVFTFNGVEEAQTEFHSLEVELETNYAHWEDECKQHEANVERIEQDIQSVLAKISKLNRTIEKRK